MEMQSLEFALMVLGLTLVLYFLTLIPILSFGMGTHTLIHCILKICNLTFDLTGTHNQEFALSLRRDFGLLKCWNCHDYGES